MINLIILLVSIIILFISLWLFKHAAGSISLLKLNTISYVFYSQILIAGFIGSVIVALGYASSHYMIELVSYRTKIWSWIAVMYSMVSMPLGMIFMNNLLDIKPIKTFSNYINKPTNFRYTPRSAFLLVFVLFMVSLLTVTYIFQNTESIPLFTLLTKGDFISAIEQRVAIKFDFQGIIYIKNLLGGFLVPMFSYIAYLYACHYKKKRFYFLFILHLLVNILLLTYDIQKAPLAFYLIGFLILSVLFKGPLHKYTFILISLLGLGTIIIAYGFQGADAWEILTNPESAFYGRLFVSSYGGCVLSFELFPDIITQPTWHIGIPQFILTAFDLPTEESARLLMQYVSPDLFFAGQAGLISSYYLGEAWANYGIIGVIFAPLIVGFVIQSLHIFLLKSTKEPFIMAFYCILSIKWVLMSGFVNFLYLKIILYPLILFVLFKISISLITKNGGSYEPINN